MRNTFSSQHKIVKQGAWLIVMLALVLFMTLSVVVSVSAAPNGPTVTVINNETKTAAAAGLINTSGGTISTVILNATTQNLRWKAFVGNVTGSLTLDDAGDNTLFDWSLTNVVGEVYATRYEGSINWSGINCSNATHISNEEVALNHTNPDDNLTATFSETTHAAFTTGTRQILANSCASVHTYVNSTSQTTNFEEVVLYDGTNETNGNIIYATPLEQDVYGFDNNTYDFQMIVPENGLATFNGATAYYFYVELT